MRPLKSRHFWKRSRTYSNQLTFEPISPREPQPNAKALGIGRASVYRVLEAGQ
jgi:hypothetical protein